MSIEHAKAMLEKIKTDKEIFEKVKAADNEGKKKIAKDLGFTFSLEDMQAAMKEDSQLSDADLEKVAGGGSATWVSVGVGGAAAAAACGW